MLGKHSKGCQTDNTYYTLTAMQKERLKLTKSIRDKFKRMRRLDAMKRMDPIEFEHYVGYLYEQDGYKAYTTVASGDEGIDLFVSKRRQTTVVQVKRYAGTVGQPVVRDLYGVMIHTKSQRAALVTTGRLSRAAESWAQGKPIDLIDGHDVASWARRTRLNSGQKVLFTSLRTVGIVAAILLCFVLGLGSVVALRTASAYLGGDEVPTLAVPTPGGSGTPIVATPPVIVEDPPPSNSSDEPVAVFNPHSLQIDGQLHEWPDDIPTVQSRHLVFQDASWDGSEDLTASWRLMWNNTHLYIALEVIDEQHVQTESGSTAYLGDSAEIQLDTNLAGDYGPQVSPDDNQYLLSPGNFSNIPPSVFRFQGNEAGQIGLADKTNALIATQRTNWGYILEAALPWAELNVKPFEGLEMGISLNVTDTDTPNAAIQETMYATAPNRTLTDPTSWGTLTLSP